MNLIEIITKVLSNSQINLILTEDGYDWAPKNNQWQTEYMVLLDQDGAVQATPSGRPDARELAEWVRENVQEWIRDAIDQEEDLYEPNEARLAFFNTLLEKF